jgi:NhaP-type Na+/H+ or K+/H+ antiporter
MLSSVLIILRLMLRRRLPIVFGLHKFIHQIEEKRQAIFVGFFGPIGVSAIFYLYLALEFVEGIEVDGVEREDAARLGESLMVVVWFLAICSIVSGKLHTPQFHKLTVQGCPRSFHPIGQARFLSSEDTLEGFHVSIQR